MKKNLVIIFFSISVFTQVKATDWFPIGAKWYWSTWCMQPQCAFYTVEITKDTIVQDKIYKKGEFRLYDENNLNGVLKSAATILFINENGKINYRFRDSVYRLYDFNLHVGDTMYTDMTLLCNSFISAVPEIKDTVLIAKSIVDSMKIIELNNIPLKQLYLHSVVDTTSTNYYKGSISFDNASFSIVEKIGMLPLISFFGFVTNTGLITAGEYGTLRCYEDNEIIYHKFINNKCDTLSVRVSSIVNNKQSNSISIFPNPTIDDFYFSLPDNNIAEKIEIYNIQGDQVFSKVINSNRIEISNLPNDVYTVKIYSNKIIYQSIIVKQ